MCENICAVVFFKIPMSVLCPASRQGPCRGTRVRSTFKSPFTSSTLKLKRQDRSFITSAHAAPPPQEGGGPPKYASIIIDE